ncbi:Late embryogenesis abundant protein, LEA_2 subgroup [Dillenia turbinata]|uniref:Late embryogenesis abundant protein, LEA_2 subgroup n=1 Tax=Dillenia turbinata TaxID=194707 RepID=A0AAN8US16_9MAGN
MNALIRNSTLNFNRRLDGYAALGHRSEKGEDREGHEWQDFSGQSGEKVIMSSLSLRRDRAMRRQIFLKTYKLTPMESSSRNTMSQRVKKLIVRMKTVFLSVLAAARVRSLRSCNCSFILITAALAAFLYFYLEPKAPRYNVTDFHVQEFKTQPDLSLYTEFVVSVKADNPNKKLGFNYGKDSSIVVSYTDSPLCSGQFPAFYQGPSNVTMLNVVLKGKSTFGSGLQQALMENRNSGRVPLLIKVKVPVTMVLEDFHFRKIDVVVNCSLVVSNLTPGNKEEGEEEEEMEEEERHLGLIIFVLESLRAELLPYHYSLQWKNVRYRNICLEFDLY